MGAQKQDALIPNVPLRYAFENTSAENLLPASPRPQGALAEAELPGKGRELSIFPVLAQQVQRVGLQAGNLQYPACLLHRGPLTFERLDAAVSLLYGFDRMPTDFFKTSMTSSFSPSCLRRLRFSASSSRMRFCSRFCLLTWPI